MFTASGEVLEQVNSFKYLGRPLSAFDSDWPALHRNMTRARRQWAMISRVLTREGANPRVSGMFYKAVVQSVLLYGSETWVRTQSMDQMLAGFHHRAARRLAGMYPKLIDGQWEYPPVAEALEAASLHPMDVYLARRRAGLLALIGARPVYDLCRNTERLPGTPTQTSVWWDQH